MLFFYQSNRLETLSQLFCQMVRNVPLSDLFGPEMIVVQSQGMERWLTLEMAKQTGIAANLHYMQPASLAWRLMTELHPDIASASPFSADALVWHLMSLLSHVRDPVYAPLHPYLAQGDDLSRFELAEQLARLFDQYVIFRPEWVRCWQDGNLAGLGEDETWQAALWQALSKDTVFNRVRMLDILLAELKPEHLPERITFFAISALAPMYLSLLKHLAQLTDICLFTLNPCEAYWGDIVDAKRQLKLQEKADLFNTDGHPLLASLGQQGRDFFESITEDAILEASPLFVSPAVDNTLLGRLQGDILRLNSPEKGRLAPMDESIQIHVAHGHRRELEILKDRLLHLFDRFPDLTPADVAILTPDIEAYAPYIDSVFAPRLLPAPSIPYRLADRRASCTEPLIGQFLCLLNVMDSRFEAEAVWACLNIPAILRRFDLTEQDMARIQPWINDVGIRWGRDAHHKAALGLKAEANHTWRWGLDRLLLGGLLPLDMAGDNNGLWQGLLPLNRAHGQQLEMLAHFSAAYSALASFAQTWETPAIPVEWISRLHAFLKTLLQPDFSEERAMLTIQQTLAEWAELVDKIDQPISFAVIRKWMQQRLDQASLTGFLSGGVTFCAMLPMRAIPFKVIGVIGLNEGSYPRNERYPSFDLLGRHPRRGDRSRRLDDRYLFLETILSARQILYLSYIGQSLRTVEAIPPSPLLSELMDCLHTMVPEEDLVRIVHHYPMQPFSEKQYEASNGDSVSYEPIFAKALSRPKQPFTPFGVSLPIEKPLSEVEWDSFLAFWQHPVRFWLDKQLGIRFYRQDDVLQDRDPFALEKPNPIREVLLETRRQAKALTPQKERLSASGLLPIGQLGEAYLQQASQDCEQCLAELPDALQLPLLPPFPFTMELNAVRLSGTLMGLRSAGHITYQAKKIYLNHKVALWLNHLLLCCVQPPQVERYSALYGLDKTIQAVHYAALSASEAKALLEPWLAYWQQGQSQPLPWLGGASLVYVETLLNEAQLFTIEKQSKALAEAAKKWDHNYAKDGYEALKNHAEYTLAFRHQDPLQDPLFGALAESLLLPMCQAEKRD